jgi:hypothetical protein
MAFSRSVTSSPSALHRLKGIFAPAASVFVITRIGIWCIAAFAFATVPRRGGGPWAGVWVRLDANYYLRIAHHGYGGDPLHLPAFFPLYPALLGGLGRLLGDFPLAGVLISLASGAVAFELLWRLAIPRIGASGAMRTVLYLGLFPMTVFLSAVYTESLFLALCIGAFFLAERGHWTWAAVAAGGTMLTRSIGVAVVVGLALLAWPSVRNLAWLLLAPAMFAVFPVVLHFQAHDALAFLHAQSHWDRHLSAFGPFGGLWDGTRALWRSPGKFSESYYLFVNIENLVYALVFLAVLPLVWTKIGKAYAVYAALALTIPMSVPPTPAGVVAYPSHFPLFSMPRFTLLAFPCFIAFAILGKRPSANLAIITASTALLVVAIFQWTLDKLP